MYKLLLFDIDGTLIRSAGAGREAMNRAFFEVFGFENGFENVHMMGRTDPGILKDVLDHYQVSWDEAQIQKFMESYWQYLEEELPKPRPNKQICPGIPDILNALKDRKDVILALLTGNWERSAFLKLDHFGLAKYFRFDLSAFADDAADRNALVPFAVRRFEKATGNKIAPENVFVIGDTPLDIACGKIHHTTTIGVATGLHSRQSLVDADADYVFDDLSDPKAILNFFI